MLQRRRTSNGGAGAGGSSIHATGAAAAARALRGEEVLAVSSGREVRSTAAPKKRLLRRGPTPGMPALLVVTEGRRGGALRMHLLAEVGLSARSWPLSDLRLVDGLGLPVRETTDFALHFAGANRPLVWAAESPSARATFLWRLLQVCASRLQSRAPPSQRLSLFELQTFAAQVEEADQKVSVPPGAAPPQASAPGTHPAQVRKVTRTASEPQPGGVSRLDSQPVAQKTPHSIAGAISKANEDAQAHAHKALNIQQRAFLIAANRLGTTPPPFKDLDLPARPQSPQQPLRPHERARSCDASPAACAAAAAAVQAARGAASEGGGSLHGVLPGEEEGSATALLVARCKAQEERRQFRLESQELEDLGRALEEFEKDAAKSDLSGLAAWVDAKVQIIESESIAETLRIEMEDESAQVAEYRNELVNTVRDAEDWLRPSEARLAPYSSLISDIQTQAHLLDLHRTNALRLRDRLHEILTEALLTPSEEARLAAVLGTMQRTPNAVAEDDMFFYGTVIPVAEELAEKVNFSPQCSLLTDMSGVASARASMLERRDALVSILAPALKERALELRGGNGASYISCSSSFSLSLLSLTSTSQVHSDSSQRSMLERTASFAHAARVLALLDPCSALALLDDYKVPAQAWTSSALQKLRADIEDRIDPPSPRTRMTSTHFLSKFIESIAALQVSEFSCAQRLLGLAAEALTTDRGDALREVLDYQFAEVKGVAEAIASAYGADHKIPVFWQCFHIFSAISAYLASGDVERVRELLKSAIGAQTINNGGFRDEDEDCLTLQSPGVSRLTISPAASEHTAFNHSPEPDGLVREKRLFSPTRALSDDAWNGPKSAELLSLGRSSQQSSQKLNGGPSSDSFVKGSKVARLIAQHEAKCKAAANNSANNNNVLPQFANVNYTSKKTEELMQKVCAYVQYSFSKHAQFCILQVQRHVDRLVSTAATKRDVTTEATSAEFFDAVKSLVDLCHDLKVAYIELRALETAPPDNVSSQFLASALKSQAAEGYKTTQYERLIAGAMKNAEMAASTAIGSHADNIRLQTYSYIAARLCDSKGDTLMEQLSELAIRGRAHVLQRLMEQRLLESLFADLRSAMNAPVSSAKRKVRSALNALDAPRIAVDLYSEVQRALGPAANTVAFSPVLRLMEEVIEHHLKEASSVLETSRELLSERSAVLKLGKSIVQCLRTHAAAAVR